MNFFEKIGKAIGHLFVGLFNAAKKAYSKLSPADQQALKDGTGLIALINQMTTNTPEEIRAAIQQKFPNLDEAKLEAALFELLNHFNLTKVTTIEEAIFEIKQYLSSLSGKGWALASHGAAAVLAAIFGDPGTKVAVFVSLIEWVYQNFIKKSTS